MSTPSSPPSTNAEFLQAALLTPHGRGAVATLRIRGDHAQLDRKDPPLFRAANGRLLSEQPFGRIVFGAWGRDPAEDVVLCRIDAATLEIHCHGGERAAERILQDWRHCGAEIVDWMHLTESTCDLLAAELQACLSRCITWRTAECLLSQADGRLRTAYQHLANADWTDAGRMQAEREISDLLQRADFGLHLSLPWRVVLTGKPNVGKSSLINALLGYQRSIVFDQPGTTRDVLTAETAFDGWPIQLADTAGLRTALESLEAEGITRARRQLVEADLVVQLIDISEPDSEFAGQHANPDMRRPPLMVAHKCDLPDRWGAALPADAIKVSSITGAGLESFQRELVHRLVPETPPISTPYPITPRQVAVLKCAQAALTTGSEPEFRATVGGLIYGP